MACPLQLDLVAFAKGELSPSEQEAVRAHVPSCVDCQEELDAVEELLGGIATLPSVRPSADFAARVTRALSANPEYAKQARETRRREKEETIRRHGWMTWAGKSLRERMSSAPGWVAAAAIYLITFGALAWVLIPRDEKTPTVASHDNHGTTPVAPPRGGDADGQTAVADPLAPGGKLLLVESRTSEARRKEMWEGAPKAIERGLGWLVAKQGEDGSWATGNVETTALATLALLGDAHRSSGGKHQGAVAKAITWIRGKQVENGSFDQDPYVHALATIAVIEDLAFGVADKAEVTEARKAVELAINFCRTSQFEDGSWGAMQATAKNCEALRQAQALGVKGCKIPLDRAGAYLSANKPGKHLNLYLRQAWLVACVWTNTPCKPDDPSDTDFEAHGFDEGRIAEFRWLANDWWFISSDKQPAWQDLLWASVVQRQSPAGTWASYGDAADETSSTAFTLLFLESPYRVAPLPK